MAHLTVAGHCLGGVKCRSLILVVSIAHFAIVTNRFDTVETAKNDFLPTVGHCFDY